MSLIRGLAPIETPDSETLILGSMPGERSLRMQQYYAHPQNAFWRILGELIGAHPTLTYPERVQRVRDHRIAIWDVLASCRRPGSLDASIDAGSMVTNDFAAFFAAHPHIRQVYFNGARAESVFKRRVAPGLSTCGVAAAFRRLPSTSPAHAAMRYEDKLAAWRALLG